MTKRVLTAAMGKSAFASMAVVACVTAACTTALPVPHQPALRTQGELHLYLQPLPREAARLDFAITSISAIRADGVAVPLRQYLSDVEAKELVAVQKRLASARLDPGLYKGIEIEIGTATLRGKSGESALLVPKTPLFIEREFTVVRKRATTLFLRMDAEEILRAGIRFEPRLSLAGPTRQLPNLLGFATHPKSNTISVFNKYTMQVVDTIATGAGPKGVVIDQRRGLVYVALAGDDAIVSIEVSSRQILGRIEMNFGDGPEELSLSRDGSTLVSANLGSNTMSIFDPGALREVGRVGLPTGATSVVINPLGSLAFALDVRSGALTAIDTTRRALVASQILEESPFRGAFSGDANNLYLITRHSQDLLIINPNSLTIEERVFVGFDAASIVVNPRNELIYVGKTTGEIVVIDRSSAMFVDTFLAKRSAAFLAIDREENSLFAVSLDSRNIEKLDLVSKRSLGVIEVEGGSYAVAVMGGR